MKTMRSIVRGLAILAPVPVILASGAFAQGAAPSTPVPSVGEASTPRQAIQWTQDRLAEADATIAALEQATAKLQGDARDKADAALTSLRAARDVYRAQAETAAADAKTWTDAQVGEAQKRLATSWAAFQSARDTYLESVSSDIATRRAVLEAELEGRRAGWQRSIEDLSARANKVAADQRASIQARIAALKAQVDDAQSRLARLNDVSQDAWTALQKSYSETRATFYETYRSIRKSMEEAAK